MLAGCSHMQMRLHKTTRSLQSQQQSAFLDLCWPSLLFCQIDQIAQQQVFMLWWHLFHSLWVPVMPLYSRRLEPISLTKQEGAVS